MNEWAIAFILLIVILGFAYKKKSLTGSACVLAFFMALIIFYAGGFLFLLTLFAFFISSSVLTKIGGKQKEQLEKVLYEKNGNRDAIQVLANGGLPTICAIFFIFSHENSFWFIAYFISFAVSTADTWASEVGLLSKAIVRSAVTFKKVEKGLSGGITVLGVSASFFGALFIALTYVILAGFNLFNFNSILICGVIGAYFDSILGELLQVKYIDSKGLVTEKSQNAIKMQGLSYINNDTVNLLSSLIGIFVYWLLLKI